MSSSPPPSNLGRRGLRNAAIMSVAMLLLMFFLYFRMEKSQRDEMADEIFGGLAGAAILYVVSVGVGYATWKYREALEAEKEERLVEKLDAKNKSGVRSSSLGLPFEEVTKGIASSPETVIVETWLDDSTLERLEPAMLESLGKSRRIRVYVLNPFSPSVTRRGRDRENKKGPEENRQSICGTLEYLARVAAKARVSAPVLPGLLAKPAASPGKLEVFCYDSLPSFSIYSWHDRAFVGFHLEGVKSSEGTHLEVDLRVGLGPQLTAHIANLGQMPSLVAVDLGRSIESQMEALRMAVPDCPEIEGAFAAAGPSKPASPLRYLVPSAILGMVIGLKTKRLDEKGGGGDGEV
ncbi:hypothetical protein OJ996_05910 [Luteolibacter sp. GHJ8]|uniref:Uncharacterized protein n=1 Tax=Luteolibacter rhizosphaerae TaxID=2989719 RepID=A0ABT3G097_9BACT|nr:hypothetical protein [Luteolibacter rhizosphaerae]MCW1913097.1 hypothetical protein [Luteolibacter rhizosphaerae]